MTCDFCDSTDCFFTGSARVCMMCYGKLFTPEEIDGTSYYFIRCPECTRAAGSVFTHDLNGVATPKILPTSNRCDYLHGVDPKVLNSRCVNYQDQPLTTNRYQKVANMEMVAKAFAVLGEAIELDERAKLVETEYDVELEYTQEDSDRQRVLSYGTYDWKAMAFVSRSTG